MTSHGHNNHNCCHNHSHDHHKKHERFAYTKEETNTFLAKSVDELIEFVNALISEEAYGKAVSILEIILKKLKADAQHENFVFEIKHHLAFAYGIIEEHKNALSLWKEIIENLEKENAIEPLLQAYHSAALSADYADETEQCQNLIHKGLAYAKAHSHPHWEAVFEYESGLNFLDSEDLKNAEKKFNSALEIYNRIPDEEGIVITQYYLGVVYEGKKETNKAKEIYEKALLFASAEERKEQFEHERELLQERLSILKAIAK